MEEEEKTERERGKGTSKRHIQQNQVRSDQIKYYLVSDYLFRRDCAFFSLSLWQGLGYFGYPHWRSIRPEEASLLRLFS